MLVDNKLVHGEIRMQSDNRPGAGPSAHGVVFVGCVEDVAQCLVFFAEIHHLNGNKSND